MYTHVESWKINVVKETLRLLEGSLFSIRRIYESCNNSKIDALRGIPGLIDQAIYVTHVLSNELYKEEKVDHGHFLLVIQKALENLYDYTLDLIKKEGLTELETIIALTYLADSVYNIERML